jgi:PAS domain S-box-containing protein
LGLILNCNSALCRLFGYTKSDIEGKNLNILLPSFLREKHHQLLLDFVNSNDDLEDYEFYDKLRFGKHRTGFIFPIQTRILSGPITSNGYKFIAHLEPDKNLSSASVAFLLLDKYKNIQGITSSHFYIFQLI